MTVVNDTRGDSNSDNTASRRKFQDRYRDVYKKAVERAIGEQDIGNIGTEGIDVTIPRRDITEPSIHHGKGGINERVLPGNKQYREGDRLKRPPGGGGGSGDGDAGEDGGDFVDKMTAEEVEQHIFHDLELPNMIKRALAASKKTKPKVAGYASSGTEQDRHLVKSKQEKLKRMIASVGPMNRDILELLQEKKSILEYAAEVQPDNKPRGWEPRTIKIRDLEKKIAALMAGPLPLMTDDHMERIDQIDDEIETLGHKKSLVPVFNESTDSKFRGRVQKPVPVSKAVMFCLMDVSGSMDDETKNNAKLFYWLLYRFLKKEYEHVELVFIRHHTEAEEVDEHTFFNDGSSGGTKVSSALIKMQEVMARYPESEWNIYGAQASDGDNFDSDNNACDKLLRGILKKVQGYFYTEITGRDHQSLWKTYEKLASDFKDRFWMAHIQERSDVVRVFRDFFKKREGAETKSAMNMGPSGP